MKRGQVSFDAMLALVAMIVFLSMLFVIFGSVESASQESAMKAQAKLILGSTADAIAAKQILRDGSNKIYFEVPDLPNSEPGSCQVTVSGGQATVSYEYKGVIEQVSTPVVGSHSLSQVCGSSEVI